MRGKSMHKHLLILGLILMMLSPLFAEVPERIEETVYVAVGFDGNDYGAITFTKENSDSLYLLSDQTSFISAKKHLTYWWPITEDWRVDSSVLDINFAGTLEIRDKKDTIRSVNPVPYTYFNLKGTYEDDWNVLTGQEALSEWERYMTLSSAYQNKLQQYEIQYQAYEGQVFELFEQYMAARDAQLPTADIEQAMKSIIAPEKPLDTLPYAVSPSYIQMGYPIKLPEGSYHIRFLLSDGSVLEGTEKQLIVFSSRRMNSVGYRITGADRWTQPDSSDNPRSVIYVDGTTDIYLQGYYQNEYPDLQYQKLIDNQSSGNPSLYRWVAIRQVPDTVLEMRTRSTNKRIQAGLYGIVQSTSNTSAYEIIALDGNQTNESVMAQKRAFHLPASELDKRTVIELIDATGKRIVSSTREIRIVTGIRYEVLAITLIAIPLAVSAIILSFRKRRLSSYA